MSAPSPVSLTHLRVKTESAIGGGMYLISRCGVRALETYYSRRRITINSLMVNCPLCRAERKPKKGKSK